MRKVCVKNGEFNWNYHEVYGEKKAIEDGYEIIDIPDGYEDCVIEDFDSNGFNIEKYNARKQKENSINYEQLVVSKIRERYTIDQELAILRQRDTKPEEFAEYNDYVEQCKAEAKEEVNGN
jgi:hypothetical protein